MGPDNCAVDHVGGKVSFDHLGQRLQHGVKDADLEPAPVATKHTVPFAVFIRQVPPLCAGPSQPHHALEVTAVILRRAAAPTAFGGQKWPDQRPFRIRQTNPIAQGPLQKKP